MTTEPAPTLILRSGHAMPVIGLGTWPLTSAEAERAVADGIAAGYRHIDTASRYENEDAVGRGIRGSGIAREDLFVTTKLRGSDIRDDDVAGGMARSLTALGTDYVDLYLIHWPLPRLDRYRSAFQEMATLAGAGLIRSIGVSNFQAHHLQRLIEDTGLVPVVDQVECDPTIQRRALRRALDAGGIVPQAWSPLGRGGPLLSDPVVVSAAADAGCTPAQVVLRWHRSRGIVPVVKSADPERQRENLAAVSMAPLDPAIAARLDDLDPDDHGERGIRDSDLHEEF